MDTTVQSTSKCGGSDFSIERILSDGSRSSREENVESPSWLCCTRYTPPRIPRSMNSTSCRPRRSGRHARVPFTAAQAAALEAAYARAPYLAPPALRALAAALQLREDRIKIWFQNRRARERREKSANMSQVLKSPVAVTLPATIHGSNITSHQSWMQQRHVYFQSLGRNSLTSYLTEPSNTKDCQLSSSCINSSYSDEEISVTTLDVETVDVDN